MSPKLVRRWRAGLLPIALVVLGSPAWAAVPGGSALVAGVAGVTAASAGVLIALVCAALWRARARERELRDEAERAGEVAEFQAVLAELATAGLTRDGLEATLALVCQRARPLVACDAV
ncbi:MAG: hypothetical protein E6J77_10500, partial [Deltaproteobacteria bacterium]